MFKNSSKALNESKKKELTQTLTFNVTADLKTSSSSNIFRMVCEGKITQIHEYLHDLTLEAKRENNENITEEIAKILNSQDSEGKSPLFYAM